MRLTFCAIGDLHFGPRGLFEGKLRKLSDLAGQLTDAFVERMNTQVRPDLALALGDLIQDESHDADLGRYRQCLQSLSRLRAPLALVAGNHDSIHLTDDELLASWKKPSLHYSFDCGDYHFAVLRTVERTDVEVRLPDEQLLWLEQDLARTSRPCVVAMHHSAADQDLHGNPWFAKAPHLALLANRKQLRATIAASGKVILVINGHVHWNQITVHDGIPYVTMQSLTENVDDDAPGRAANAVAVVTLQDRSVRVVIDGAAPTRYEHHRE